jgi:hypothetical protein
MGVQSCEQWAMSGNFWVGREGKYLQLHPIVSYTCGILPQIVKIMFILIWVEINLNIFVSKTFNPSKIASTF